MDSGIKKSFSHKRFLLLAAAAVGVVVIAAFFWRQKAAAYTYFTAPVQRGPIRNVVNATGTVQAVLTVQVGIQITGQIEALYADYNSIVKRGQLLAKIDPRNFQAQAEQAKANVLASQARVQTAEADLKNQLANLESSKANLEAARVARENTAQIFRRYTELQQGGIVSQNDYDTAKANAEGSAAKYNQAAAAVEQVQAQINSSRAQLEQAKAQVEQAQAAFNQAQVNLDYTTIISPVDGVVVSRNVDVGQTVSASLQAPTLFVIANDLTQMQVNANVDEADIGTISYDSDVRFTVDAYPNRTFTGKIAEIRLNPQTIQNVVTYSVIVNVRNERLELKPGMTANLTVTVAQQDDIVKVPNAALRYLPPDVTREQVAEMMRKGPGEMASSSGPPPSPTSLNPPTAAGEAKPAGDRELAGGDRHPPWGGGSGGRSPEERGSFLRQSHDQAGEARQMPSEKFGSASPGGTEKQSRMAGKESLSGSSGQVRLAPGQKWDPAEKIQFPTPRQRSVRPAVVWVLDAQNKPEARRVLLGVTDGAATQVVSGEVKETDKVIVGDTSQAAPTARTGGVPGGPTFIPFGGGGGGRR